MNVPLDSTPAPDRAEPYDVLVVGAGQAGLATAYHLRRRGLRYVVVDGAESLGDSWRSRWDSLRLFTPAEHDGLPGLAFPAPAGSHPGKDEVAAYLAEYARRFEIPVLLGCRVSRLTRSGDVFEAETSRGVLRARRVVVATGPFQVPAVPALARDLDPGIRQVHSAAYRRPADLPAGPVLVVGAGNSGRQIALELAATHEVTLATGSAPVQLPQRLLGRDLFWWLTRLGLMDRTADSRLARRMRARGDIVIGTPLARLRRAGVTLRDRVSSAAGATVGFATGPDLRPSSVVWATGFRPDHSWIDVPGVLDGNGLPQHSRGIAPVAGLAFVGLPWQHTRGSSLLGFVAEDAAWVVDQLAGRPLEVPTPS